MSAFKNFSIIFKTNGKSAINEITGVSETLKKLSSEADKSKGKMNNVFGDSNATSKRAKKIKDESDALVKSAENSERIAKSRRRSAKQIKEESEKTISKSKPKSDERKKRDSDILDEIRNARTANRLADVENYKSKIRAKKERANLRESVVAAHKANTDLKKEGVRKRLLDEEERLNETQKVKRLNLITSKRAAALRAQKQADNQAKYENKDVEARTKAYEKLTKAIANAASKYVLFNFVYKGLKGAMDTSEQRAVFAQTYGSDDKTMDKWGRLAEQKGYSYQNFMSTYAGLSKNLQGAPLGLAPNFVEAANMLGVNMYGKDNKPVSPEEFLNRTAAQFKLRGYDKAQQQNFGQRLGFDPGTISLLGMNKQERDSSLEQLSKEGVISEKYLSEVRQFNESMTGIWQNIKSMWSKGTESFLNFANTFIAVIKKATGVASESTAGSAVGLAVAGAATFGFAALAKKALLKGFKFGKRLLTKGSSAASEAGGARTATSAAEASAKAGEFAFSEEAMLGADVVGGAIASKSLKLAAAAAAVIAIKDFIDYKLLHKKGTLTEGFIDAFDKTFDKNEKNIPQIPNQSNNTNNTTTKIVNVNVESPSLIAQGLKPYEVNQTMADHLKNTIYHTTVSAFHGENKL